MIVICYEGKDRKAKRVVWSNTTGPFEMVSASNRLKEMKRSGEAHGGMIIQGKGAWQRAGMYLSEELEF